MPPLVGGRVQPIVLRAEGLPDEVFDWQDTELDVPCHLALAAYGERRCLPRLTLEPTILFVDAASERELFIGPSTDCGDSVPRYQTMPIRATSAPWRSEALEVEPAPRNVATAPLFHATYSPTGAKIANRHPSPPRRSRARH